MYPDGESCEVPEEGREGTYGIKQNGNGVDVGFVTQGPYAVKVGFRFYLMLHDKEYKLVHMLGKEISFNVDMPI